jgi:HEPN domain-containing protein
MNLNSYIEGWYLKADHDLIAAQKELASNEPLTDIACFHCQQCVEKYLKAFLTFHGKKFPKTHVLEDLTFLCSEIDTTFEALTDQVADLTGFAVEIRYPDTLFIPTVEQAESALKTAVLVKEFVRSRICNL